MPKPICEGLNLRPLQKQLRQELGDLARFQHQYNSLKSKGIIVEPMYLDYEAARATIYERYNDCKNRMIQAHKDREKINARNVSQYIPF